MLPRDALPDLRDHPQLMHRGAIGAVRLPEVFPAVGLIVSLDIAPEVTGAYTSAMIKTVRTCVAVNLPIALPD